MITRHINGYGAAECNAYEEVGRYKWREDFSCRRPGCGYEKYFEGKTPFSRRCLKCKRDESVTAHTAFDKLRMSLSACLEIARMVMVSNEKLKIEELTQDLKVKGHVGVNTKSVWLVLHRIYKVMNDKPTVFDDEALFTAIIRRPKIVVVSKGKLKGKDVYNVFTVREEIEINTLVKKHTTSDTKTTVAYIRYLNNPRPKINKRDVSSYRPPSLAGPDVALLLAKDFIPWVSIPGAYIYKRNGNQYSDLMRMLIRNYSTTSG